MFNVTPFYGTCVVKAQGFLLFSHASSTADRYCQNSSAYSSTDKDINKLRSDRFKPRKVKPPQKYSKFFNSKDDSSERNIFCF